MIQCPKCNNSLPDWSQTCQFCQTDLKGVARPKAPQDKHQRSVFAPPVWVWPTYYVVFSIQLILNVIRVVMGIQIKNAGANPEMGGFSPTFGQGMIVIFGLSALLSVGMLARVEIVRTITKIFAFISIAFGMLGLIGSFLVSWPAVAQSVFGLLINAFIIYLIIETDDERDL